MKPPTNIFAQPRYQDPKGPKHKKHKPDPEQRVMCIFPFMNTFMNSAFTRLRVFGQRCDCVLRDRAGGGGCPRFRTRSKELGHFEKVSGRCAWFIAKAENAQIAREMSPIRLIDGFVESVLMPLCILGGINVDVPLLGGVLK